MWSDSKRGNLNIDSRDKIRVDGLFLYTRGCCLLDKARRSDRQYSIRMSRKIITGASGYELVVTA